jgi:hypothetical protein
VYQDKLFRSFSTGSIIGMHSTADGQPIWQMTDFAVAYPVGGTPIFQGQSMFIMDANAKLWKLSVDALPTTPEPPVTPQPPTPTPPPRPVPPPNERPDLVALYPEGGILAGTPLVLSSGGIAISYIDDVGQPTFEVVNVTKMQAAGMTTEHAVVHQPIETPNGTVLFYSAATVVEFDPNFGPIWIRQRGLTANKVVVDGGYAFVPMGDAQRATNLTAMSLAYSGNDVWSYSAITYLGNPITHEGKVFVMDGTTLVALNQDTGLVAWFLDTPCGIETPEIGIVTHDDGLKALVVFGAHDSATSTVCRLHHWTGAVEWSQGISGEVTAVGGGFGYLWVAEATYTGVYTLNATTGKVIVRMDGGADKVRQCPPVIQEYAACPDSGDCTMQGIIFYAKGTQIVAQQLGGMFRILWQQNVSDCTQQPVVVDNTLLVVDNTVGMAAFDWMRRGAIDWVAFYDAATAPQIDPVTQNIVAFAQNADIYVYGQHTAPTTPVPTPLPTGNTPGRPSGGGISGGAVAAIVLVIVVLGGIAFGVIHHKRQSVRRRAGGADSNLQGTYGEIPDN